MLHYDFFLKKPLILPRLVLVYKHLLILLYCDHLTGRWIMHFAILTLILLGVSAITLGGFIKVCRLMNGCITHSNSADNHQ
jgi:hypothetical protein